MQNDKACSFIVSNTAYVIDIDTLKLQKNNSYDKCLLIPDDYTISIISIDIGKNEYFYYLMLMKTTY